MGGIRGTWEKFWGYVPYVTLISYSILLIYFFERGTPPSQEHMGIFVLAFILIGIIASSQRKYSLMILALLALAFSFYIYSYNLQYPASDPEDIYSDFNFRASDIVEFQNRETQLIFDYEKTVLKDRLTFYIWSKNINETATLRLHPPKSTESYKIYVVHQEMVQVGIMSTPSPVILLSKERDHVENNTFPELEKLEVPLKAGGHYVIITEYELPKMDPFYVRLNLWGGKNGAQINFKNVHSAVYFSDMSYECIDPCIVIRSANITTGPPYAQKTNMLDEDADEKPFRSYYVEGVNVEVIKYDIRTSWKWAIVIRNLMLSIIAGLIVALTLIGIRNNSNSYK